MATTTEVPGRFDVAINGRGFMLFEDGEQPALVRQSIRQQREQAAGANANIGEATVNPEGFWRRSIDDWSHGMGQSYYDREDSDPARFHDSEGVDVFGTKHQLTLLHATDVAYTSASGGTLHSLLYVDGRVWVSAETGGVLRFTAAPLTVPWTTTTITGAPSTVRGLAALNGTVYIAGDNTNLYSASSSGPTASAFTTGASLSGVAVAKGRLFAWDGGDLYNITASGALPSALATFNGTIFGVVGQKNWVYIAVSESSQTLIYKTTIKADGTALDTPVVAGELPPYETLWPTARHPIFGYAGFLFVASRLGLRTASIDDNGDLTFGPLIPATTAEPRAFAAHDRFVYFCMGSQVYQMDLTAFTGPNTPAYVKHVPGSPTGFSLSDLVVIEGRVVFVQEDGDLTVQVESATTYVASGWVESGLIAHDLADAKTPVAIDVEGAYPSTTTVVEALSTDRGTTYTTVATLDADDDDEASITGVDPARQIAIKTTLTAGTSNLTTPTVYRHTLKVEPGVNQGDYVIMRLRLFESVVDNTGTGGGYGTGRTPASDLAFLRGLQQARTVADIQEGALDYTGTLRDLDWQAQSRCASADDGSWNGIATVRLKVVA